MITDPQLMREILARPDVFWKPQPDPIGHTVAGGLLFLEGEKWAKHRKIINPAFNTDKLKSMVSVIGLSCSDTIAKWEALVDSKGGGSNSAVEIDVWPFIADLSGDVISRVAFGSSHEQGRRIFELHKEVVKLTLELMQFMSIPGWRFIPTKANRRTKAISEEIRSILTGIINQREKAMERNEAVEGDLLGTLLESSNGEAHSMTVEEVIEECKLFYFAGSDTISVLVIWTMVMLSKHQEWQAKAREEVLQVFRNGHPCYDGLNRLKIVTMILNEVLRMFPSAPLLTRAPTKTVKLGDMTVPIGVELMLLIGEMHHDPIIWGNDVSEFKPERLESGVRGKSGFMPFSFGPRVCIGQNLAMIEAKIMVAMMLQRFSFELSPSYLHAPFLILTLQPQHGVPLLLRKFE
ncbi:cytochrome P450 72A14-like isoform X2 [Salvia hispanica]|nr:cytochrome P450 72A14-like isoform X2 [Salvia hispanica]